MFLNIYKIILKIFYNILWKLTVTILYCYKVTVTEEQVDN